MTILAAGSANTRALWYLTRGTGVVSLLLLTAVVGLGLLTQVRWSHPRWPRFVTMDLHRNISLLAVVFLVVHILTAVADPFAPLKLADAVLPFGSRYRPLWVGLGAVALDLLLALIVTSLVRVRLGHRRWRAIHWLAYAAWPVAVLHGLGTGSDARTPWAEFVTWSCVALVVMGVWWRIGQRWPERGGVRATAALASVAVPIGLAAFTVTGPLQQGWAARAGTPSSVLSPARGTPVSASTSSGNSAAAALPYTGTFAGALRQSARGDGTSVVRLTGTVAGRPDWQLDITLVGQTLASGGVAMTGSSVSLTSTAGSLRGQVDGLEGDLLTAQLTDGQGSTVRMRLQLSASGTTARGSLTMTLASDTAQ